ncbi:Bug family tripartite tricarboxylate transporter substrate binding protein [Pseudaquabacterium pictum]|uniref:Exported protein n=1 Tax=Pseudaquabacterium pictum TaxID=2315236 RepID=A0A480AH32_9BURK|nr:tripartite tricarboxylate transporter substrate binding protein [Rubrivivax pictus]GCL60964.1 exported protein [Rubrivivax pictus]
MPHTLPVPSRRQLLLGASALLLPGLSAAQPAWPTKPVRILTPFTAGGATDVIARNLAAILQATHKQPFNVEPKPGADGALAAQELLRSAPDGHTLYLATASALSYVPNVRRNPGYDALKDFTPLTQFMTFSFYLMVHESLPGKTLAEVLAHVKSRPATYSYGSGNSTALLAAAQLATSAGVDLVHAPYKGESQAVVDMVGGRVHMMWASPAVMPALLKDGKFRPLAVLLSERSAAYPDVPTIAEAGMPLVNVVPWGGFVVPSSTPPELSAAVARALREGIGHPDLRGPADKAGLALRPGPAEDFSRLIQQQLGAFGQAIKQAKVPLEG